jgi:hypothetical protein
MKALTTYTESHPLPLAEIHPRRREMISAAAAQVDGCRGGQFLHIHREGEKWDFWLTPYLTLPVAGWRVVAAHCATVGALCRMGLDWQHKMGVGQGHAFAWIIDDEGYPLEFLGLLYGGDVWDDHALADACGLTPRHLVTMSASQTQARLVAAQKGGK